MSIMKTDKLIRCICLIALWLLFSATCALPLRAETVLTVGGDSQYKTISEAVAIALPGTTVFVKNGVYTESVKVINDISIVGESRDGVILQYPCTYYQLPPLEAHCGTYKNLTIKATPDTNGIAGVRSYAVHCEKAYSLAGSAINFENCKFESAGNWDVGMGSCNGFTATFRNCRFCNMGMFYHTFGTNLGIPTVSALNLLDCDFADNSSFSINNCFANSSVLKVNSAGTHFPTMGMMMVISNADVAGKQIIDNNFMYGAKNVFWNQ